MIADLDGDDLPGPDCLQLARKMTSPLLDLRKCAHNFPVGVNDGREVAVPCARSFPRLQNRIV